jgi:hypothetical protein
MTPQRIQRRRTKGWRMPENTVYVGRGTKWGNPWVVHEHCEACGEDLESCDKPINASTREGATRKFRYAYAYPLIGQPAMPDADEVRYELAGKNLMCWCPLDQPCHADVLLEIANQEEP